MSYEVKIPSTTAEPAKKEQFLAPLAHTRKATHAEVPLSHPPAGFRTPALARVAVSRLALARRAAAELPAARAAEHPELPAPLATSDATRTRWHRAQGRALGVTVLLVVAPAPELPPSPTRTVHRAGP